MLQFARRLSLALLPVGILACSSDTMPDAPPPGGDWTLSADAVAALPVLSVTDGRTVCVADGAAPCPLRQPIANWIDRDHFALWEPGRSVQLWGPGETPLDVSGVGPAIEQYQTALAVGPGVSDYIEIINLGETGVALRSFDERGRFIKETALPPLRVGEARGFAGKLPLLQRMSAKGDTGVTMFQVFALDKVTDSVGRLLVEVELPWLQLAGDDVQSPPPLFITAPVYVLLEDGEAVEGPGNSGQLVRRMADGTPRWKLSMELPRVEITAEEVAARTVNIRSLMGAEATDSMLAVMTAKSETAHPAIASLLAARNGTIYLAGPATARSEIDYYRLAADGQPNGRFQLPKGDRVLLAAGDSLLVQRPHEGQWRRIQWIRLESTP